jgi:hypothetical protein
MLRTSTILASLFALSLGACASGSNSSEPTKEGAKSPEKEVVAAKEDEGPPAFEVDVKDWEGPTGEEGQVVVTVKAKTGFKINDKYPHKVTLDAPPDGVSLPMTTIAKKDAQLNGDKSITYTIPATCSKAGQYKLSGVVKLSVCNEETCRMAKEKIAANVTAQ